MVNFLLQGKDGAHGKDMHNGTTSSTLETPLFYAFTKLKSQADKIPMVSAFLEHSDVINFEHTNSEGLTIVEVQQN